MNPELETELRALAAQFDRLVRAMEALGDKQAKYHAQAPKVRAYRLLLESGLTAQQAVDAFARILASCGGAAPDRVCAPAREAKGTPADLMAREDNGRFAAGFERLCTCGHRLGVHAAANQKPCFAGDFDPAVDCDCERFKAAGR